MANDLKHKIDPASAARLQNRCRPEAENAERERQIRAENARLERQQRFCTMVLDIMDKAAADFNLRMENPSETCELRDVSAYFSRALFLGACNPIAYELRVNGEGFGDVLAIELTEGGKVEAVLCTCGPHVQETHRSIGWRSVPLDKSDLETASDLLLKYLKTVMYKALV